MFKSLKALLLVMLSNELKLVSLLDLQLGLPSLIVLFAPIKVIYIWLNNVNKHVNNMSNTLEHVNFLIGILIGLKKLGYYSPCKF